MRYSKRQSEAGKAPFVRSRGDRYANAPVESMTGLAAPDFCNDPDDAPKPTAEFFKCADLYGGTKF